MTQPPAALQPIAHTIAALVRNVSEPELILLFGSRARGDAHAHSDYDLFLVVAHDDDTAAVAGRVRAELSAHGFSVDVIVRSAERYRHQQRDPGLLDFLVAREGVVLYASGRVGQRDDAGHQVREEPPREGLELWIRRAESDLRNAEQSLGAAEPVWDAIAFHAHACAEKYLKALVVQAGRFPPRTHELAELLADDAVSPIANATVVAACAMLMSVWPASRYPELAEPTPDEARQALAAAREVRGAARARLPLSS